MIRLMKIEDYEEVYQLWKHIEGFGIRSIDDSEQGVETFLKRNPETSFVAELDGKIVGSLLCGNDGRVGHFYHVCVAKNYRHKRIGTRMAHAAMEALKKEGVSVISLRAFKNNEAGNGFWKKVGWRKREDLYEYDFILNEENITTFIS